MMSKPKKIILAIASDFIRNIYVEIFKKEEFEVLEARTGKIAIELLKQELPNIALLDSSLGEINGFEILKILKKEEATRAIPVVIFTQIEREGEKAKAFDLEAKDFIVSTEITPLKVVDRIKIVLGEQRTYRVPIDIESKETQKMAADLNYRNGLKCQKCGTSLVLYMMRDLKAGKSHFVVSLICSECN